MLLFLNPNVVMAKRRTKKQKVAASTRHNFESVLTIRSEGSQTRFTLPTAQTSPTEVKTAPRVIVHSYAYVLHDAKNTLIITVLLVALDIAIYSFLKLRLLSIPGVGF